MMMRLSQTTKRWNRETSLFIFVPLKADSKWLMKMA